MIKDSGTKKSLWAAGLAAIGASVCCVGPLLLLTLGVGGSWASSLTEFESIRPIMMAVTFGILAYTFRKLYIAPRKCVEGEVCAIPSVQRNQRIIFWVVSGFIVVLLTFPYYAQYILD